MIRIPVNVKTRAEQPAVQDRPEPSVSEAKAAMSPAGAGDGIVDRDWDWPVASPEQAAEAASASRAAPAVKQPPRDSSQESDSARPTPLRSGMLFPESSVDWRDRALRLQAEMDNTRKRLQRDQALQIEAERQRLLRSFLRVVDDLERALAAPAGDRGASRSRSIPTEGSGPQGAGEGCEALRQGVQLTHRAALQLLEGEGVEQIQVAASGQPFDPNWHEAVMTVDHGHAGAAPDTIVEVVEPGYRRQDQLLRPARVIVAV